MTKAAHYPITDSHDALAILDQAFAYFEPVDEASHTQKIPERDGYIDYFEAA